VLGHGQECLPVDEQGLLHQLAQVFRKRLLRRGPAAPRSLPGELHEFGRRLRRGGHQRPASGRLRWPADRRRPQDHAAQARGHRDEGVGDILARHELDDFVDDGADGLLYSDGVGRGVERVACHERMALALQLLGQGVDVGLRLADDEDEPLVAFLARWHTYAPSMCLGNPPPGMETIGQLRASLQSFMEEAWREEGRGQDRPSSASSTPSPPRARLTGGRVGVLAVRELLGYFPVLQVDDDLGRPIGLGDGASAGDGLWLRAVPAQGLGLLLLPYLPASFGVWQYVIDASGHGVAVFPVPYVRSLSSSVDDTLAAPSAIIAVSS